MLRRLRHRTRATGTTEHQAAVARSNIQAAAAFLDWLAKHDLTLATCAQADLDTWMAAASTSQRGPTGAFIRWTKRQKLTTLEFPAIRWHGPIRVIDTEARWKRARRLLADDSLKPEDRFAGLLVLLYAQQPATISRLSIDHVHWTCPGFRVLAAAVYGGELEVLIETAPTAVACARCGRPLHHRLHHAAHTGYAAPLFETVLQGVEAMQPLVKPETVTLVVVLTDGRDEDTAYAMSRSEFLSGWMACGIGTGRRPCSASGTARTRAWRRWRASRRRPMAGRWPRTTRATWPAP